MTDRSAPVPISAPVSEEYLECSRVWGRVKCMSNVRIYPDLFGRCVVAGGESASDFVVRLVPPRVCGVALSRVMDRGVVSYEKAIWCVIDSSFSLSDASSSSNEASRELKGYGSIIVFDKDVLLSSSVCSTSWIYSI